MINLNFIIVLIFSILKFIVCLEYKPVVLFHGIMSGSESMETLQREIEMNHPGTKVYNCDLFSEWYSLENAWKQVEQLRDYLDKIGKKHPKGIHVLGYSQGGLLARAAIQSLQNHNVINFISLSSPQAGQYGTSFLHLIFPDLAAKTAYEVFYSKVGQLTSVGNYWNDPFKQDLYLNYSIFLPLINNEVESSNSSTFKSAITRLNTFILIGGPNDGVITPWESSHFGYYDESLNVIPVDQRNIFTFDTIGLRYLQEKRKLKIIVKPFIHHLMWHRNIHIIRTTILPFLD